jgi:hypothetical protein
MSDVAPHKPLRWSQDDNGDISMMRIGAMIGVCVGGAAVVAGIVLAIYEVASQAKVTEGVALAGVGAGLISLALTTKALQRGAEAKIANGGTS